MGLSSESLQLSSTTFCEQFCWKKRDFRRKNRPKASIGVDNRLLGRLCYPSASCVPRCHLGYPKLIFAEACSQRHVVASDDGAFSVDHSAGIELPELDQCNRSNPPNSAPNVCPPNEPTGWRDGELGERGDPKASVLTDPSGSSFGSSDYVGHSEQLTQSLDGATNDVLASASPSDRGILPPAQLYNDADVSDAGAKDNVNISTNPANADAIEEKGKIRRFSLNEPGLLKTLQEAKPLTPLEKSKLDLVMKYKLTNNNLKGHLVIRAARTEQLKDLEDLLTDSYSELMWGPLTYRPALAWILRAYLRERQAYLPHAVTLVGLYSPSEEANVDQESGPKWWLAGAVEISFDASGKPKDMQTPLPPEDAPFLSNMAVFKKFRRRGIGRELLKASEELVMQMGGNEMYLHCRMVDEAPLNMYKSSGYSVVETDSFLSLLLFQRRRHLMYKRLGAPVYEH